VKYVTQSEFDATAARIEARRDAVTEARRALRAARTLEEKKAASIALKDARNMRVI